MMNYFHYIDKINVIALLLMVIVFCVIFENFERFEKRQGSILYIYISLMTTILHFIRNSFLHQINYKSFVNYSIAICLIGVVFALITEVICVFSNYTVTKEIKKLKTKPKKKKETIKQNYIEEKLEKIEQTIKQEIPRFAYQKSQFSNDQVDSMRNQIKAAIMNEYEVVKEDKGNEDLLKIARELEKKIQKSEIKSQDQHAKLDKIKA